MRLVEQVTPYDFPTLKGEEEVAAKYQRGAALVASVFNKYHNGSHRAVDAAVINALLKHEDSLFSLQCLVDQGPAAIVREGKESEVRAIAASVVASPDKAPTNGSWLASLALCGGFITTPNNVMRKWDDLGDMDKPAAMHAYLEIVDVCLPGWDDPPEFPVALQDQFWTDDATTPACPRCHGVFTLQNRRHHVRLRQLDQVKIALVPPVPRHLLPRMHPACRRDAALARRAGAAMAHLRRMQSTSTHAMWLGLSEVRRLLAHNREIKAKIQAIAKATETAMAEKTVVAAALRQDAAARGCNLDALDATVDSRASGPQTMEVQTPPAHKFRPSESVEAGEQLRVANRQLVLCLKVAETRAKRVLDKMDTAVAVFEDAIRDNTITWHPIAQAVVPHLSVVDMLHLAQTTRAMHAYIEQHDLVRQSCLRVSFHPSYRPQVWMWRACLDPDTHKYLCELAETLTAQLGPDDLSDEELHWSSIMLKATPVWAEAYALVLNKCGDVGTLEHDKQIVTDVKRTFGRSPLRRQTHRKSHDEDEGDDLERKKAALEHVLRAFTATHSNMGYCQGMNFVAAFMLSSVHWNEAQAFWLLTAVSVSPQYQLMDMYRPGVPLLNLRFYQLHMLVKMLLPDLHMHFEAQDFHESMCASGWFMTLFTNCDTLPATAVVRVMDCFLVYGWVIIFRVALALLKYLQADILKVEFEEIVDIFYSLDDSLWILQPENLIQAANKIQVATPSSPPSKLMKVTDAMLDTLQRDYETEFPGTLATPVRDATISSPVFPRSPPKDKAHLTRSDTTPLPPSGIATSDGMHVAPPLSRLLSFLPVSTPAATSAVTTPPDTVCKQM
ncbi:Aste57867_15345 [Aphanomyces stellatus]|uniref:Aste57867_15345 protein n=1 Tax=Aphanomyces stellatus TaxID=120398 RepID=A0A485L372_9STRA|nr:hypothetical protein As57867_015289 [Aphanomyces stellatus]VFT92153.1 Aste57867_15345 [Aphanomyces stellatus]